MNSESLRFFQSKSEKHNTKKGGQGLLFNITKYSIQLTTKP